MAEKDLNPEVKAVLKEGATEAPFSGKHLDNKEKGVYSCAGCGAALFSSDAKYDSGTGWPSYFKPIDKNAVVTLTDNTHGMSRAEVKCAKCIGHLGHVFQDGPAPTGLRYCINSLSLDFESD